MQGAEWGVWGTFGGAQICPGDGVCGGRGVRTAWPGAPWTPRGDGCVKGPPSPAQPPPMPADTHLKGAAACPAPGIVAHTG